MLNSLLYSLLNSWMQQWIQQWIQQTMTKGFKKIFCFTWIVTSFDASCLHFYQNVKKVWFSWSQGQKRPKIVEVFGIEYFLSILHFGWKIFKLEKTTFLDELGNFKHFEPYFIFCHCLLNSLSHSLLNSIRHCWKRCWRQIWIL